ncbi:MAG: M4 family metallopeptidase [Gammaproteobacteria bacterium]|nr:M4 family metallopeptidase [Gammaproteobacteria bacterium]
MQTIKYFSVVALAGIGLISALMISPTARAEQTDDLADRLLKKHKFYQTVTPGTVRTPLPASIRSLFEKPSGTANNDKINSSRLSSRKNIFHIPTGKFKGQRIDEKQVLSLQSLTESRVNGVEARFSDQGTVELLSLSGITPSVRSKRNQWPEQTTAATAIAFLGEIQDLLGVQDAASEFAFKSVRLDSLGKTHVLFNQQIGSIPVWGKHIRLHLDSDGEVYQLSGHYVKSVDNFDTMPVITADSAVEAVRNDLGARSRSVEAEGLVIFMVQGEPVLSYKVRANVSLVEEWLYFVDAGNGRLLHRVSDVSDGNVASARAPNDLGEQESFTVWQEDNTYYLVDPTYPKNDVEADTDPVNDGIKEDGDTLVTDMRNGTDRTTFDYITSRNTSSGWDPIAVGVIADMRRVYDYFLNRFSRHSLDNEGMNLIANIHYGEKYNNAGFNGRDMVFGDGDGVKYRSFARCTDIIAHEMAHGVTRNTAALIYENQSGALNESFSDLFGALIEGNWVHGEDCTIAAPGFHRSLINPEQGIIPQPAKMSDYRNLPIDKDHGGVHINSGIPNRAGYLIADAIGNDKAEQIFYRTLSFYLTPSATMLDARRGMLQAAEDLYGAESAEVRAVAAAWDDVEVVEGGSGQPGDNDPTSTDIVDGDDVLYYITPQDGTFGEDFTQEVYDVYSVNFSSSDKTPKGPANLVEARWSRPVPVTISENETIVYYLGQDRKIYFIRENGENRVLNKYSNVQSFTVSPDDRFLAYIENNTAGLTTIIVNDARTNTVRRFPIILPSTAQGSDDTTSTPVLVDAMDFDFSSGSLIFDLLVCTSVPSNICTDDEDSGIRHWTIGILNLSDSASLDSRGRFRYPVDPTETGVLIGNPVFATNNRHVIAMDLVVPDYEAGTIGSAFITLNLDTNKIKTGFSFGSNNSYAVVSQPSFWGDDESVVFTVPDGEGIYGTARVPLSEETDWEGETDRAAYINRSHDVQYSTMHRVGVRSVDKRLEINVTELDFGAIDGPGSKTLPVTLYNAGNSDIDIVNINTANSAFSHNGLNTLLPRDQSMTIEVTFQPNNPGTSNGTLVINSNGTPDSISIALKGRASGIPSEDDGGSSSSRGGGGVPGVVLLIMLLAAGLRTIVCVRVDGNSVKSVRTNRR